MNGAVAAGVGRELPAVFVGATHQRQEGVVVHGLDARRVGALRVRRLEHPRAFGDGAVEEHLHAPELQPIVAEAAGYPPVVQQREARGQARLGVEPQQHRGPYRAGSPCARACEYARISRGVRAGSRMLVMPASQ